MAAPLYDLQVRAPASRDAFAIGTIALPSVGGGEDVGKAVARLGDTAVSVIAHVQEATAQSDKQLAHAEGIKRLYKLETDQVQNQDFRAAPTEFRTGADQVIRDVAGGVPNPKHRAELVNSLTGTAISAQRRVDHQAIARRDDAGTAALDVAEQAERRNIALAASPVEAATAAARIQQQWDAAATAGTLSQAARVARQQRFELQVGQDTIARIDTDLVAYRNQIAAAADAPGVAAATASARVAGEGALNKAPIEAFQRDAAVRAWHRQVADAGLARLAAVDPAAARLAGGRGGIAAGVGAAIRAAESGGRVDAANPQSTALGPDQFIERTWLDMIAAHRPEIAVGKTRAEILALRTDPTLSGDMRDRYAEQNAGALRARGLPVTGTNVYLAHFLGAGGAVGVLSVDPSTPVERVLSAEAIEKNRRVLEGKTAGQVIAWADRRMGREAGTQAVTAGDPLYAAVPFERRIAILDSGEQRAATDLSTLTQAAERARKLASEAALKEAHALNDRGELTRDFVESAVRPLVSPAEYQGLLKTLGPDAAVDHPAAMIELTRRIDTDDPAEFAKAAVGYLNDNKLKTSTFLSLSEKNRTARKDDTPASPYKSGRDLVTKALEPGLLVTGAARAPLAMAQANAQIEFDNWSAATPQASRAEAIEQAQGIVKRYEIVPLEGMKVSLGISRYFGVKARGEITLAHVETAEKALLREIEAGGLTAAQQFTEINLINNWREILVREANNSKRPDGPKR